MKDLRTRILLLAGLVALVTALVCSLAADAVARRNLQAYEDRTIATGMVCLHRQLDDLLAYLGNETMEYACWDELYQHLPRLERDWTAINLTPGLNAGGLTQVMVLEGDGKVLGRFRNGDQRGAGSSAADPASAADLAPFLGGDRLVTGLALLGGHPALYACAPVLKSDRSGPARGHLLCLAYFTPELIRRCEIHGFTLQVSGQAGPCSAPAAWTMEPPVIQRGSHLMTVDVPVVVPDGRLALHLTLDEDGQRVDVTTSTIAGTGLLVALLASVLGGWLGWWWLRPIQRLVRDCRQAGADAPDLAVACGLQEADQLALAFNQRLATEREARRRLTEALEREATSHAVQRRFLGNLGQELGQPLRQVIALVDRISAPSSSPAPELLVEARQCAIMLEERFHEILGLANHSTVGSGFGKVMPLRHFLVGLADQLRPQAQARGLTLTVEAPDDALFIPVRMLMPVLVNLVANAVRATASGGVVLAAVRRDRQTEWLITDTGPGIPAELAVRIADCCRRGEVIPGTAGLGLGLALALANVRSLGGRMELAANGPQGASFRVIVPEM